MSSIPTVRPRGRAQVTARHRVGLTAPPPPPPLPSMAPVPAPEETRSKDVEVVDGIPLARGNGCWCLVVDTNRPGEAGATGPEPLVVRCTAHTVGAAVKAKRARDALTMLRPTLAVGAPVGAGTLRGLQGAIDRPTTTLPDRLLLTAGRAAAVLVVTAHPGPAMKVGDLLDGIVARTAVEIRPSAGTVSIVTVVLSQADQLDAAISVAIRDALEVGVEMRICFGAQRQGWRQSIPLIREVV